MTQLSAPARERAHREEPPPPPRKETAENAVAEAPKPAAPRIALLTEPRPAPTPTPREPEALRPTPAPARFEPLRRPLAPTPRAAHPQAPAPPEAPPQGPTIEVVIGRITVQAVITPPAAARPPAAPAAPLLSLDQYLKQRGARR